MIPIVGINVENLLVQSLFGSPNVSGMSVEELLMKVLDDEQTPPAPSYVFITLAVSGTMPDDYSYSVDFYIQRADNDVFIYKRNPAAGTDYYTTYEEDVSRYPSGRVITEYPQFSINLNNPTLKLQMNPGSYILTEYSSSGDLLSATQFTVNQAGSATVTLNHIVYKAETTTTLVCAQDSLEPDTHEYQDGWWKTYAAAPGNGFGLTPYGDDPAAEAFARAALGVVSSFWNSDDLHSGRKINDTACVLVYQNLVVTTNTTPVPLVVTVQEEKEITPYEDWGDWYAIKSYEYSGDELDVYQYSYDKRWNVEGAVNENVTEWHAPNVDWRHILYLNGEETGWSCDMMDGCTFYDNTKTAQSTASDWTGGSSIYVTGSPSGYYDWIAGAYIGYNSSTPPAQYQLYYRLYYSAGGYLGDEYTIDFTDNVLTITQRTYDHDTYTDNTYVEYDWSDSAYPYDISSNINSYLQNTYNPSAQRVDINLYSSYTDGWDISYIFYSTLKERLTYTVP